MIILMGYVHLNPSNVNKFTVDVQSVVYSTRAGKRCLLYAFTSENARVGRMLAVQRRQDQESLMPPILENMSLRPF